jgi:hypothetical protein
VTVDPGFFATASAILMLFGLVAMLVGGVRARRSDVVAAGGIGLMLLAAAGVITASTPTTTNLTLSTIDYTLWWAAAAGMWIWLALGWGLVLALARWSAAWTEDGRSLAPRPAPALLVGAFAVLLVAAVTTSNRMRPDEQRALYEPARTLVERVNGQLPQDGYVRVDTPFSVTGLTVQSALILDMRMRGIRVSAPNLGRELGPPYRDDPPYDARLRVYEGPVDLTPGTRVLGRMRMPQLGFQAPTVVTVAMSPNPG